MSSMYMNNWYHVDIFGPPDSGPPIGIVEKMDVDHHVDRADVYGGRLGYRYGVQDTVADIVIRGTPELAELLDYFYGERAEVAISAYPKSPYVVLGVITRMVSQCVPYQSRQAGKAMGVPFNKPEYELEIFLQMDVVDEIHYMPHLPARQLAD